MNKNNIFDDENDAIKYPILSNENSADEDESRNNTDKNKQKNMIEKQKEAFYEMVHAPLNQYYEIRIEDENRGRGLFATRDIPKFTLIHTAPCIHIPIAEYENHLKFTELEHYVFHCASTGGKMVALGHGSLFNHDSKKPNVDYIIDSNLCCIRYRTLYKEIKSGEELCISYGAKVWWDESQSESESESEDEGDICQFLSKIEL